MTEKDPQVLNSYHPDEVVSVEDIEKHAPECLITSWTISNCNCTPTKGKRIVIEVWDDFVVEVKNDADK